MRIKCFWLLQNLILARREDADTNAPATPFEILEDRSISDSSAIVSTSASYYQLMIVAAAIGLVASLMVIGISLMMSKRADKRSEKKQELVYKIMLGIGIFAFVFVINVIYHIAIVF